MMKKTLAIAGAGAILLSMAGPVFGCWPFCGLSSDDVTIRNTGATVTNRITNSANSGRDYISGMCVYGGRIVTGSAVAVTDVLNQVNYNEVGCDCVDGDVDIGNTGATVTNRITNSANSGRNHIGGMFVGGGVIHTGYAGAETIVSNLVNTNIVGGVL